MAEKKSTNRADAVELVDMALGETNLAKTAHLIIQTTTPQAVMVILTEAITIVDLVTETIIDEIAVVTVIEIAIVIAEIAKNVKLSLDQMMYYCQSVVY